MILNESPAIYVDGKMAERVYSDGEIVWGLPKGYKRCKYLESSGTQWIDTRIYPTNKTSYNISFAVTKKASTFSSIFGARYLYNQDALYLGYSSNIVYFGRDGQTQGRETNGPYWDKNLNTWFYVELNLQDDYLYVNGTKQWSTYNNTFSCPYSIYLFVLNQRSVLIEPGCVRIQTVNFLSDSIPIGGFIPCLDYYGKPCMYDTVSKAAFYNQGTGEFGYELLDGTYIAPV